MVQIHDQIIFFTALIESPPGYPSFSTTDSSYRSQGHSQKHSEVCSRNSTDLLSNLDVLRLWEGTQTTVIMFVTLELLQPTGSKEFLFFRFRKYY